MVEAACALFAQRGYSAPLSAVAERAGVAVQTINFTFHSKLALLQEVLDFAVLGDDLPVPPLERRWFRDLAGEPDQRRALVLIVQNTEPILQRASPIAAIFHTLINDPDAAVFWADRERLRHESYRQFVGALRSRGRLRKGLSEDEATDILFVVLSPELFQSIVGGRGWTVDHWRSWTTQTLEEALLGPAQTI